RRLRIGRFRISSSMAALLTICSFYAVLIGILMIFLPTIVAQARNLASVDYQALGQKLQGPFSNLDIQLHKMGMLAPGESLSHRVETILSEYFKPTLLGEFLGGFLGAAGAFLLTLSIVTFIMFFFLKESNLFLKIVHALVPNEVEPKVRLAIQESSEMLTRYFGGLAVQLTAFALLVSALLWILGVENALLIGAFAGIFNVIPYIGPIFGMIFGAFITISSHLDLDFSLIIPMLIKVVLIIYAVHFLDTSILGPLIFSKSVQAHPLEIFIVTLMAANLGGVAGMVVGIPVYTILRVIGRNFFSRFKVVQRLTEHLEESE
ncbi:MAG: AI-2E family transporter, partial [Bacteroidetes bacterium]|nr:AI-2E family transporter [Bacteroidota bacterium]